MVMGCGVPVRGKAGQIFWLREIFILVDLESVDMYGYFKHRKHERDVLM